MLCHYMDTFVCGIGMLNMLVAFQQGLSKVTRLSTMILVDMSINLANYCGIPAVHIPANIVPFLIIMMIYLEAEISSVELAQLMNATIGVLFLFKLIFTRPNEESSKVTYSV